MERLLILLGRVFGGHCRCGGRGKVCIDGPPSQKKGLVLNEIAAIRGSTVLIIIFVATV